MNDAVAELERVARFAQISRGLLPEWAGRPMLPHEMRSGVNFAEMDDLLEDGYDASERAAVEVRDLMVADLRARLAEEGAGSDPLKIAAVVTLWATALRSDLVAALSRVAARLAGRYALVDDAAAGQVAQEAVRQGQAPGRPAAAAGAALYVSQAQSVVQMARQQVLTAALGVSQGGRTAEQVLAAVSGAKLGPAIDLGRQAVHIASGAGRARQAEQVPAEPKEIYSSELLDSNTCSRCAEVDGRSYESLQEAYQDYPGGGPFRLCEGGPRCRGILVIVWASEADATVRNLPTPLSQ